MIESNEAFASQALAVAKGLELDLKRPTSTAAPLPWATRWAARALIAARRCTSCTAGKGRYALVTMCIGGGRALPWCLNACNPRCAENHAPPSGDAGGGVVHEAPRTRTQCSEAIPLSVADTARSRHNARRIV